MSWRIGVDIGGTFTDVALIEEATGRIGVAKSLTTPQDFAQGVLSALDTAMRRYKIAATDVSLLAHATTIVTNALLEQKGARAALVATRGFRDVLELRRSSRGDLYDLFQDPPAVLIPRRRRFEITERIGADGEHRHAARRGRDRRPDRRPDSGQRAGDRSVAAVQLSQRRARAAPRRTTARSISEDPHLPVVGGAARDQGVRADQYDGCLCLRSGRSSPPILIAWKARCAVSACHRFMSWGRTAACSRPRKACACRRWRSSRDPPPASSARH